MGFQKNQPFTELQLGSFPSRLRRIPCSRRCRWVASTDGGWFLMGFIRGNDHWSLIWMEGTSIFQWFLNIYIYIYISFKYHILYHTISYSTSIWLKGIEGGWFSIFGWFMGWCNDWCTVLWYAQLFLVNFVMWWTCSASLRNTTG